MNAFSAIADDFEVLEPGVYSAAFRAVEIPDKPGDFGPYMIWHFEVLSDDGPVAVTGRSSLPERFTRATKARVWFEEILGRRTEKGEVLDFANLVGRPCQLRLEVRETDLGAFNRVLDVTRARTPKRTPSVGATPTSDDGYVGDELEEE